jgi:hypothetical protein
MEIVWIITGIIAVIALVFLIYNVLRQTTHIVSEEQRVVIYRLGRFNRIAGPGMVQVIPGLEQVTRTLDVRNHPMEVVVPGVFAFGLLNDLTLNLWYSYDLVKAAAGNKAKLAELVQLSETERRRQVEVKMREALVNQIAELQKRMPLPGTPTGLDGVIALAPGSERYNELLAGLKRELEKTLPSVGVVLNTDQTITVTGRGIPDGVVEAIKRFQGRQIDSQWLTNYADQLRHQFPEMSSTVLDQMLASIEGVDVGNVQRLRLEQDDKTDAQVEFEVPMDGSETPVVIAKPKFKFQETEAKRQPASVRSDQAPSSPRLSEEDLTVLKRVPRSNREQRKIA